MVNIYKELDTMCLRCECKSMKCGTVVHCKAYNNVYDALKVLEKIVAEKKRVEAKLP